MLRLLLTSVLAFEVATAAFGNETSITGRNVRVTWTESSDGWSAQLQTKGANGIWQDASAPMGQYGLLANYTTASQDSMAVKLGQAGEYSEFLPANVTMSGTHSTMSTTNVVKSGTLTATWWVDTSRSWDVIAVNMTWEPTESGWYSLASPRLSVVPDDQVGWGVVPGYWSSNQLESNEQLLYTYVQGVPTGPYVSVEASTTSLVAVLSNNQTKYTFAVVADPSLARDPYPSSSPSAQTQWNVGMSLRGRNGTLSPTCYYPVLGQAHSQMTGGNSSISATFLYLVSEDPSVSWYEVNKLVHNEIYPISGYGDRAEDSLSLRERLNNIYNFLVTPASQWHLWTYENLTLGAESGKLSDVGGMWMTHALTGDPFMLSERLPYARNFKLAQQDTSGDVFNGAALGEYFKNGSFVSELIWADINNEDYVSPIFTTFYTLSDMGNIILFNSSDDLVLSRFELAAEKLLSWQQPSGAFQVGYLKSDPSTIKYPYITDNRATWYGFVSAYRILKDKKYLDAAEAGARWFITNVIDTGRWIGVCDDSYLYPDFSTVFAAQALLDLYKETGIGDYLDAAVAAAKYYTLHIYNHPLVDNTTRTRSGTTFQDWQLSQMCLNYEHAGYTGSVNNNGPILLSSHAGAFIRFYEITGDQFFLDLARYAARGRDAFVDPRSSIPSYYWTQGNTGGSTYPWHGWWHIGWVTDYLMASAHILSDGKIDFPYGFITAKVGSHVPYGFASGTIYGQTADLWQPLDLLNVSDHAVDYVTARSTDGSKLFVITINEALTAKMVTLSLDPRSLVPFQVATWGASSALAGSASKTGDNTWSVAMPANGLAVLSIQTSLRPDPQGPELRTLNVSGSAKAPVVSWSFWTTVESWAEWAILGSGVWTSLPATTNYNFSTSIDLADVNATNVKIRIASQEGQFVGISDAVFWTIS